MDSTPPSHRSNPSSQKKSASRLARIRYSLIEPNEEAPPSLTLDLNSPTPKKTLSPSVLSIRSPNSLPLHELLLLSPPVRRSRSRLTERLEMAAEEAVEPGVPRKRSKTRAVQKGLSSCASPRNNRRSRRRSETEVRDEKEVGPVDEFGKARKRRHSTRSKKEKLGSVPSLPSPSSPPKVEDVDQGDLDRIGEMIGDLVMWRDTAKSSLWFGLGCLCFLSSCFAKGVNYSIFSAASQLGLLFLGASFFSNSICQRNNEEKRRELKLREEDIVRAARRILPAANFAISKTREIFSGEPSMTLKVTPFMLLGAEYGHLITLWRLCAFGFLFSFTVPKLYSCYALRINGKAENMKTRVVEAWRACAHKKIAAASAVTAFWNFTSIKTRIFTAFIFLVIIRYRRQSIKLNPDGVEAECVAEEQPPPEQPQADNLVQEQALAIVGVEGQKL